MVRDNARLGLIAKAVGEVDADAVAPMGPSAQFARLIQRADVFAARLSPLNMAELLKPS
jgi:hypothetical protein